MPERPAADAPRPSVLRALAGAGLALGGVVLAVVALLTVTTPEQEGSPALVEAAEPVYDTPALPPTAAATPAAEPTPSAASAGAPGAPVPAASAPAAPAPAAPAPAATTAAPAVATAAPAGPPLLPVLVLNNSRETGLAARAAARFERAGWPVRRTGNFTGRIRATTVYFEPGQQASAERFAATFRGIARVLPRPEYIPGPRGLAVVLTRDFPA